MEKVVLNKRIQAVLLIVVVAVLVASVAVGGNINRQSTYNRQASDTDASKEKFETMLIIEEEEMTSEQNVEISTDEEGKIQSILTDDGTSIDLEKDEIETELKDNGDVAYKVEEGTEVIVDKNGQAKVVTTQTVTKEVSKPAEGETTQSQNKGNTADTNSVNTTGNTNNSTTAKKNSTSTTTAKNVVNTTAKQNQMSSQQATTLPAVGQTSTTAAETQKQTSNAATDTTVQPSTETSVSETATEQATEPATQPVTEQVTEPVTEPAAEQQTTEAERENITKPSAWTDLATKKNSVWEKIKEDISADEE